MRDVHLNPIALAIPFFFLAIGIEYLLARRRNARVYRFTDAITDLSCGVGSQVTGIVLRTAVLGAYVYAYDHWSFVHFAPGSPWPWIIAFVGVDFMYYWWHRLSHEVNFMWAAHIVHHQSEDYNLAVALRQAWFTSLTGIPFYLPLALLGVGPVPYTASIALSLLYQFWIHTELIDRLGPAEAVMNTPSHHRVHHATNLEYLDKNYAAILIIWDRMFGTFEPEKAPCVYGITKPFGSFNPVWANFHYWKEIGGLARRCSGIDVLLAAFRRPGWDPKTRRIELPPGVNRDRFVKFHAPPPSRVLFAYVVANFALIGVAVTALLLTFERLPGLPLAFAVGLIVLATAAWGALFERRPWAVPLEAARLVGSVGVGVWLVAG